MNLIITNHFEKLHFAISVQNPSSDVCAKTVRPNHEKKVQIIIDGLQVRPYKCAQDLTKYQPKFEKPKEYSVV